MSTRLIYRNMVVKYFNVHDGSLIYTYEHCVNATPENGKDGATDNDSRRYIGRKVC